HKEELQQLFQQYLDGKYSPEDLEKLIAGFQDPETAVYLQSLMDRYFAGSDPGRAQASDRIRKILEVTDARMLAAVPLPVQDGINPKKRAFRFWTYAAAAILIGFVVYFTGSSILQHNTIAS